MKTFIESWFLLAVVLTSCTSQFTAVPIETATFIPSSTFTPLPTASLTKTPVPTATRQREISTTDVGLPWNPSEIEGHVQIMPCYLFSSSMFHAGDAFYFPPGNSDTKYNVLAPADGTIVRASYINDAVGYEITVKTSFLLNDKPVFYDIVHTSGLAEGLTEFSFIQKGDNLAVKKNEHLDPIGKWIVDIGFRNGEKQANASLLEWTGLGYFSYTRLLQDDIEQLAPNQFSMLPKCAGNPIQQSKPYATPTPGGFTYP